MHNAFGKDALPLGTTPAAAIPAIARDTARLFEAGFEESQIGMQLLDADGRFLRVNAAFAELVGRTADELVGMGWRDITHPDDLAIAPITGLADDNARSARVKRKRYLRPDASVVWGQVTVSSITVSAAAGGEHTMLLGQVIDVTEVMETMAQLQTTHVELATSERRYRALVDPSPDAIARLTAEGIILDANETAATMVGSERNRVVGKRFHEVVEPILADVIRGALGRVATTGRPVEVDHYWLTPATGEPGWYRIRVLPESADDAPASNVYIVATDITVMVDNERRLSAMALEDSLTGVANRAAMLSRVEHALDRLARRPGTGLVLASIDVDHFKSINDTFGHAAGDHALQAVARALTQSLRQEDTIARLGGDEFLVLVEDVHDESEVARVAERLDHTLNVISVELPSGQDFKIGSSIGLAYTTQAMPIEDLIARADRAAYEAKRRGRQRCWIDAESMGSTHAPRRSDLLRSLRTGIARDRFVLLYQPLANGDGEIAAVEALLRWYDDDDVLRAPDHFLDTLMESGLMADVGEWVVAKAIEDLATWQNESSTLGALVMNINVSAGEIVRSGFADFIGATMVGAGVDPKSVAFEVTEQSLGDTSISTRALDLIAQTGAKIVLDDFGTGISSLTHLRTKSLNGIKIDRSFISDAMTNDTDRRIAEGVIDLAHRLGIEVTAEGVETWEQANWLLGAKCNLFQGWYVGRPAPAAEVPRFEMPAGLRSASLR